MAKELQPINDDGLGPIPDIFKNRTVDTSDFTSGLQPSFPVVSIRNSRWGIRFGGVTTPFVEQRAGGQETPVPWLDVILVAAQTGISKSYYEGDFDPNSNEPPDCWSSDGIRPDDTSRNRQNPICGTCRQNLRGSKVVGDKKLKACTDIKRVAVVRQEEIDNPLGPVLLRVVPGSQSNYRTYVQWLAGRHRAPYMVVTRLTFDADATFPKIQFQALRGLSPEEAAGVAEVLDHPMLNSVLVGKDGLSYVDPEQAEEDAAGGLPPTGGLPPADAPAKQEWGKTTTVTKPTPPTPPSKPAPEPKPALTPEQQKIADLEAQLAQAKAPKPEPKPEPKLEPVLTPEQLKIRELEAQLAQVKTTKPRGRPRSQPVGPPTSTASVTSPSNGSGESEKSADNFTNDLNLRIDKFAPKAT